MTRLAPQELARKTEGRDVPTVLLVKEHILVEISDIMAGLQAVFMQEPLRRRMDSEFDELRTRSPEFFLEFEVREFFRKFPFDAGQAATIPSLQVVLTQALARTIPIVTINDAGITRVVSEGKKAGKRFETLQPHSDKRDDAVWDVSHDVIFKGVQMNAPKKLRSSNSSRALELKESATKLLLEKLGVEKKIFEL